MRPALYYPWVYLKGGAERVVAELMMRSRHDWTLYTNRFERDATFPELRRLKVVTLPEISVKRTIHHVARAALTLLTQRLDLREHDSLLVISEGLGNLQASRSSLPTSCICLTPLKVTYDPVTRERFFNGRARPHYRLAFSAYRRIERRAWRRYERIFCNSEEVRRRVLVNRLADPDRVEVVHHGVDLERFRPGGAEAGFFLVPGRMMWQKNIELAIAAWKQFKPRAGDNRFRLVIAGMVDRKSRAYVEQMRFLAIGRTDIVFVESPSDDQMLELYRTCRAVVFPPPSEDWGLVALEAMACGKPVLAVDAAGPAESVLDGVCGYLRPPRPEPFAAALRQLAQASLAELAAFALQARTRACRFPWSRFVDRMDDHVEELGTRAWKSGEEVEMVTAMASGPGPAKPAETAGRPAR